MFEILVANASPLIFLSRVAGWDLGRGESQVITRALGRDNAAVVLDDRQARRCADSLDISLLGTIGVILIAKQRGWIDAARPVIDQLIATGMYLRPSLVDGASAEVGE